MSLFSRIVGDPVADKQKARERLSKAAGIGTVNLVCHAATWHFICVRLPVFGRPEVVHDGTMAKAALSGPNVVKILSVTYKESRSVLSNAADRAIARRIYIAVAEVVDMVDPDANPGRPVPDIVIDDRVGDQ